MEDLILAFVTASTKVLKKDEELADGAWKYELNTHISLFLELVSDALHLTGQTSPELAARIDSYRTRLRAPDPPTKDANDRGSSDRGHGESDAASVRSQRKDHQPQEGLRSPHTEAVARVFGLSEDALTGKLKDLQTVCTEQAALEDLKVSWYCYRLLSLSYSPASSGSTPILLSPTVPTTSRSPPCGPHIANPRCRHCLK